MATSIVRCVGRLPKAEAANCAWLLASFGLFLGFWTSDCDDLEHGSHRRESFKAVGSQEAAGSRWI